MTYKGFTYELALRTFSLKDNQEDLFPEVERVQPSEWLRESLSFGLPLAVPGSEKAKSEFIIAPMLLEVVKRFGANKLIYSGRRFNVDKERGLIGECDFLIAKGNTVHIVHTPVLAVVEAKKDDLENGFGQCASQMVAAQILSRQEGNEITSIYGCVTTANDWKFLRLQADVMTIDAPTYYLNQLPEILGILKTIVART